jgi:hypothetical protein
MRIERQALAGSSMFRFLFRFAGLVVITISFLFVIYDGTKSIGRLILWREPVTSAAE